MRRILWRRWIITTGLVLAVLLFLFIRLRLPAPLGGQMMVSMSFSDLSKGGLYTFDPVERSYQKIPFPEPVPALENTNYNPILSPDQQQVAFQTFGEYPSGKLHLARSRTDGTIIASTSGPFDYQPRWSPDGQRVIFGRSINFISALFLLDLTSGDERQLTGFTNDIEPDWSPDGQWIVFTTNRDGFQELYRMRPDGGQVERLTETMNLNDFNASYSPDGQQIAYMTNYSVGDGSGEIWVMRADGSNQRRLTDNQQDDLSPIWSPESHRLAFTRTAPDRTSSDLWIVDVASQDTYKLTTLPGYEYAPVWSPDGEWIAFTSSLDGGQSELFAIRIDGSDLTMLLTGGDLRSAQADAWLTTSP